MCLCLDKKIWILIWKLGLYFLRWTFEITKTIWEFVWKNNIFDSKIGIKSGKLVKKMKRSPDEKHTKINWYALTHTGNIYINLVSMCSVNLFIPFIWRTLHFISKGSPFLFLFLCYCTLGLLFSMSSFLCFYILLYFSKFMFLFFLVHRSILLKNMQAPS